jgi:hypothetical protein
MSPPRVKAASANSSSSCVDFFIPALAHDAACRPPLDDGKEAEQVRPVKVLLVTAAAEGYSPHPLHARQGKPMNESYASFTKELLILHFSITPAVPGVLSQKSQSHSG